MHILAISGSSSSKSINRALLESAVSDLPATVDVEVVSILDLGAPLFSVDVEASEGVPSALLELHAKIARADAVILASPEHNGGMPAMLKNTIDWLSRVKPGERWLTKPLALLSASPGPAGGSSNLAHIASLAPWWGADVVGSFSLGKFSSGFDVEEKRVTDPATQDEMAELMIRLEERARSSDRSDAVAVV